MYVEADECMVKMKKHQEPKTHKNICENCSSYPENRQTCRTEQDFKGFLLLVKKHSGFLKQQSTTVFSCSSSTKHEIQV